MKDPQHIPTIVEKAVVAEEQIFGVICAQCSDTAEDYIVCKYIKRQFNKFPVEVMGLLYEE